MIPPIYRAYKNFQEWIKYWQRTPAYMIGKWLSQITDKLYIWVIQNNLYIKFQDLAFRDHIYLVDPCLMDLSCISIYYLQSLISLLNPLKTTTKKWMEWSWAKLRLLISSQIWKPPNWKEILFHTLEEQKYALIQ